MEVESRKEREPVIEVVELEAELMKLANEEVEVDLVPELEVKQIESVK